MRFALFCKSFRDDLDRFNRLIDSADRHNADRITFVLSVPRADRALFANRIGNHRVHWLCDEDLLGRAAQQSWRVQQLVKLQAFRADFADAWFVLDSDDYFVRPYHTKDFVRETGEVALVASTVSHVLDDSWAEINAYLGDPSGDSPSLDLAPSSQNARALPGIPCYESWLDALRRPTHDQRLSRIQALFSRPGVPVYFMPAPIWTRDSLASMVRQWLEPRGLSFEALIRYSPWEAAWVGEWELFRGSPQRFRVPPYFVHIRSDRTISRAREVGLDERAVAKRYLGIQLAARHQSLLGLDPG